MNQLAAYAADGLAEHWVDILSVLGGILYMMLCHKRRIGADRIFLSKRTGIDFFSGLAFAPLALMFVAAFSGHVMRALLSSSRITLAGASVIALFALLEEEKL